MQVEQVRTIQQRIKDKSLAVSFSALALAVKNLQNSTRWVIRQVLAAYEEGVLKNLEDLHPSQLKALELAQEACALVNKTKADKNEKRKIDYDAAAVQVRLELTVQRLFLVTEVRVKQLHLYPVAHQYSVLVVKVLTATFMITAWMLDLTLVTVVREAITLRVALEALVLLSLFTNINNNI